MSNGVEVIGMIGPQREASDGASVHVIGGAIDLGWVRDFAQAHEAAGFDRALVGYSSTAADSFLIAQYAASQTTRLGYLIAHRPGFIGPTLAARTIATLDHVTGGRIALHVITGGSDAEQRRDGDFYDHDTRYRRTDEWVDVVRRVWTSAEPFDYEGEFYKVERAYSDVKPLQQPHVPVYFGGSSGPALEVAAKHCDVYATWGEPLAAVKTRIAEVKALAARYGRNPGISVSFRPILGATEEAAWERAHAILASIQSKGPGGGAGPTRGQSVGARRLVEFAGQAEVHDKRLWMAIAAAVGGSGNSSALVGTPAQVADALMDYYDIGVTTFLMRGFDPMNDAIDYGRELIPLIREGVAQREAAKAAAVS